MKHCLKQLNDLRNTVQVKEIIRQLDEGFRAPKASQRKNLNADGSNHVSEVYSPERITGYAKGFNLDPGCALDLTTMDPEDGLPYDFSIPEKRERVKKKLDQEKPFMLVLCPMCGPFSTLQNFNYARMESDEIMRKVSDALIHIKFAVELCISQHMAGRLFMFEHPAGASSWASEALQVLGGLEGVMQANFDFCTMGMRVGDRPRAEVKNYPVKKRTKIMTNSHALYTLLREAQCGGRHAQHADLRDGKASECQEYPEAFCRAVCEAIKRELSTIEWRNRICKRYDISHTFERLLSAQTKVEKLATPPEEEYMKELYDGMEFFDDTTGAPLDKELAIKARKLEIDYFRKMKVYSKIKREPWMKVITTRWLDINKGDEQSPNYRSRLVGREIKKDKRTDLFAATPPLESLRMILSICAMNQNSYDQSKNFVIMSNDVKRAYFYAPTTRPVYIAIPAEDWEHGDDQRVGLLNLSLYGTRDAAMNWTLKFTKFLEKLGFRTGTASPCNFYHDVRKVSLTVHGDDFTSTGNEGNLQWLARCMAAEFEIKTDVLGPKPEHAKELRILNRGSRMDGEWLDL